ncbi:MAG TPA: hypothetical protein V6C72_05720 [Chroococcales cyanobacterium]
MKKAAKTRMRGHSSSKLESADDDIDYLHPDGKPRVSEQQKQVDKSEREKPVSEKSIEEADGHHMCTAQCRNRHAQH